MLHWNTIWSFETARFRITLDVAPEDTDPAACFEFDEHIEAVRSGAVDWFMARCVVYFDGCEIASDYLGGCAYESAEDFVTGHRDPDPMNRNCTLMREKRGNNVVICHYFPDMVRQAVAEARRALAAMQDVRLRA